MGTIYLVNIFYEILIYSNYTLINVAIISRLIMLIIILEYICNMVVHIHSKYTFITHNTPNYIPQESQDTPLYIHRVATRLVMFATNGT